MGKTGASKILMENLYDKCVWNRDENGRMLLRCILGKCVHEMVVEMDVNRV
jgi:hypothetical protein